jgi:hypothetical protein
MYVSQMGASPNASGASSATASIPPALKQLKSDLALFYSRSAEAGPDGQRMIGVRA